MTRNCLVKRLIAMTNTLKTTEFDRNELLKHRINSYADHEPVSISFGELKDLCHDADRVEEYQQLYESTRKVLAETSTAQENELRKEIADLRTKLDEAANNACAALQSIKIDLYGDINRLEAIAAVMSALKEQEKKA